MTGGLEVERKYDLAVGQDLPPLDEVVVPGRVDEFDLEATYFDTPDHRLSRARQVIRRRVGGSDDGWHLKSPGAGPDERVELHEPIGPTSAVLPPPALRQRVAAVLDDAPLVPVAVLRTHRREQELRGTDGTLLARSCTDDVRARSGAHHDHWREAEVELAGGPPDLLDRIEAVLARAGVVRAGHGSKLAKALGRPAEPRPLGPGSSAAEVVLAYLARQVGVLQRFEEPRAEPEAVHDARVAARRVRSTLRAYGRLISGPAPAAAAKRLRAFGQVVGAARDAEVVLADLTDRVARLHPDIRPDASVLVLGPLEARLRRVDDDLVARAPGRDPALQQVLIDLLDAQRLGPDAAGPARDVLPALRGRRLSKVRRRVADASGHPGLEGWHAVRKAAKDARYATELLLPAMPELAASKAAWERVTERLGRVQDIVVATRLLSELDLETAAVGAPAPVVDELRHGLLAELAPTLAEGRDAVAAALALG